MARRLQPEASWRACNCRGCLGAELAWGGGRLGHRKSPQPADLGIASFPELILINPVRSSSQ